MFLLISVLLSFFPANCTNSDSLDVHVSFVNFTYEELVLDYSHPGGELINQKMTTGKTTIVFEASEGFSGYFKVKRGNECVLDSIGYQISRKDLDESLIKDLGRYWYNKEDLCE